MKQIRVHVGSRDIQFDIHKIDLSKGDLMVHPRQVENYRAEGFTCIRDRYHHYLTEEVISFRETPSLFTTFSVLRDIGEVYLQQSWDRFCGRGEVRLLENSLLLDYICENYLIFKIIDPRLPFTLEDGISNVEFNHRAFNVDVFHSQPIKEEDLLRVASVTVRTRSILFGYVS